MGVIRCPSCGQANRLPDLAEGKKAVCGRCRTPLPANGQRGHPIELTDANFQQVTAQGASLVDFWAAWCGPCRMIAPVLEQVAAERGDIQIGKLNVDENPKTAARFNVQGIPLLVFFKNGIEQGRVVGAVPKSQIDAAIRRYFG